jgi:hypothetical protein
MSEFLDKAITAHNSWKTRLKTAIEGGEIPDESKVAVDNMCDLGKWIHADGIKLSALPEYVDLKAKHARFHQAAAKVVKLIKSGNKPAASEELEGGEYRKVSSEVIAAIVKLKGCNVA